MPARGAEQELERLPEGAVVLDDDDPDRGQARAELRALLGGEKQRVVRLAALVHLELELGVVRGELGRAVRRAAGAPRR